MRVTVRQLSAVTATTTPEVKAMMRCAQTSADAQLAHRNRTICTQQTAFRQLWLCMTPVLLCRVSTSKQQTHIHAGRHINKLKTALASAAALSTWVLEDAATLPDSR